MSDLCFAEFYNAVHGHEPFPWQVDLTADVLRTGQWPALIDVPTGLGKTSIIDIGVYVAAVAGCGIGGPGRRRTFFVIDRRVVVDEAFVHAATLATQLRTADPQSVAGQVGNRLRQLANLEVHEDPLLVARMRGGITWDWRWLDRPDRAAVVVGTVDQLGSRLAFRGYGLSSKLAPLDAAHVGTDSLLVVDEAHLADPFRQFVSSALDLDQPAEPVPVSQPSVVIMSATPPTSAAAVAGISERDERHPVAGARLHAPKRLHTVRPEGKSHSAATVEAMASAALALASEPGPSVVGVVCNTVARARAVFDRVRTGRNANEVALLTGRIRPFDRERVIEEVMKHIGVDRDRATSRSFIAVSTQTIEVGVNADFDALITESSPWSSLVQRLGRLNRVGRSDRATLALVVHDGEASPLYGDARERTWQWLTELCPARSVEEVLHAPLAGIDASVAAVRSLTAAMVDRREFELPQAHCPTLTTSELDAWTHTFPLPATDPPVEPFLHGFVDQEADVRLLWRADIEPGDGSDVARSLARSIAETPPHPDEMLEVPLRAVRRWLTGSGSHPVADVSGVAGDDENERVGKGVHPVGAVIVRSGGDTPSEVVFPDDRGRMRPNDLIVLPAWVGGCDGYGWCPDDAGPVRDLADLVTIADRSARVRFHDAVLRSLVPDAGTDERRAWLRRAEAAVQSDDREMLEETVGEVIRRANIAVDVAGLRWRRSRAGWPIVEVDSPQRLRMRHGSDRSGSPLSSSGSGRQVTLAEHQQAVERLARSIAGSLGLPSDLVEAVGLAAGWHDVGKLDPRFQAALRGGVNDPLDPVGAPLAKSGMDPADQRSFRLAHRRAGLPAGFRHEAGSAQAVEQFAAGLGSSVDRELLVHLVAAHHGRSRPLLPPVDDRGEESEHSWNGQVVVLTPAASVDWASPRRFEQLNRKYGRWGLALLETIVRLADIECSVEGS